MLAKRIIPCLDVTGGRVVKGVNFVELRDAGDPVEIAARYNELPQVWEEPQVKHRGLRATTPHKWAEAASHTRDSSPVVNL